jgi:hypothetical protein
MSFPQCMSYPVPFASPDLHAHLHFLCHSPKFFIWNHFWPMDFQYSSQAAVKEGLQLWCGSFHFFPWLRSI